MANTRQTTLMFLTSVHSSTGQGSCGIRQCIHIRRFPCLTSAAQPNSSTTPDAERRRDPRHARQEGNTRGLKTLRSSQDFWQKAPDTSSINALGLGLRGDGDDAMTARSRAFPKRGVSKARKATARERRVETRLTSAALELPLPGKCLAKRVRSSHSNRQGDESPARSGNYALTLLSPPA